MKTSFSRHRQSGFVSFLLVLSVGAILTMLMIFAYRRALASQSVQSQVQLRVDYTEKEDAILRSIVAITPNRAIKAMQQDSSLAANSAALSWNSIFTASLTQANARTSISPQLANSLNIQDLKLGNSGDFSNSANPSGIFSAISPDVGLVSVGINRNLGPDYPAPLTSLDAVVNVNDPTYPIISDNKRATTVAAGASPNFDVLPYPDISFGYGTPRMPFVTKRNWWAFSMNVAAANAAQTLLARKRRDFVLSIYEVPSQLGISASSAMSLGQYTGGAAWDAARVRINGGLYVGRPTVVGNTALPALASRRAMSLADTATIGGEGFTAAAGPFTPGVKETYYQTTGETFFPVSQASESGRAAFIAINPGARFFDRYFDPNGPAVPATDTLSPTTWAEYTCGALRCAMQLDVVEVVDANLNKTPIMYRFSYLVNNARVINPLMFTPADYAADVCPFEAKTLPDTGQICIAVNPQRLPAFLALLGGDPVSINNSLVVNVDDTGNGPTFFTRGGTKPQIPCRNDDLGVVLQECEDLTPFTKGFSFVTNMRVYFGDNFNITPRTAGGTDYPPCSVFTPEKRYGVDINQFAVTIGGQIGSLAKSERVENNEAPLPTVSPLDSRNRAGQLLPAGQITVNLTSINNTANLPPICMMNWLVLLEEIRP